jgi:hypothetical protein
MSGGNLDHAIRASQAEVHRYKSEYIEARNIHTQILQEVSLEQDAYPHAFTLFNIVEIDLCIGAPKDEIQRIIDKIRTIVQPMGDAMLLQWCDVGQADIYHRVGDMVAARALLQKGFKTARGKHAEIVSSCLEKLGDPSYWNDSRCTSVWTTVFLVYSLRSKGKLEIHKALQFFGDNFLAQGDEDTAINLFIVALGGFTRMDVHRGRAECMLRLGVIAKRHGNLMKAVELWQIARPLFERSLQQKQVEYIDERLAAIRDGNSRDECEMNSAQPTELNVLSGTLKEPSDTPSEIEDPKKLDLEK